MNNLERAVIEAAKEYAHTGWDHESELLKAAVERLEEDAPQPTRFLVSYARSGPRGSGFGSLYHSREYGGMPDADDIRDMRDTVARECGTFTSSVVILSISEISPEGDPVA